MSVSLLEYLQLGLPSLPIADNADRRPNTASCAFNHTDIHYVGVWTDFKLATIQQRYQDLLTTATLPPDPFIYSPPRPILHKRSFISRTWKDDTPTSAPRAPSGFHSP